MRYFKTQQYYMLVRVKNLLEKNKTKLSARAPILKKRIPEYNDKFDVIHQMVVGRLKTTFIDTADKMTAKEGLMEAILNLVAVLRDHYSSEDSREMPEEASYRFSKLNRASLKELPDLCGKVISEIKKVNNLDDYGLSRGDIIEAEAYLEEYSKIKTGPQLRKDEIAKLNETINTSIAKCIIFLENKIDPIMLLATKDNKELKVRYDAFRKVLVRGPGNISDKEKKYRKSRNKRTLSKVNEKDLPKKKRKENG